MMFLIIWMSPQYASCPIAIDIFMKRFFDRIGIEHSSLICFWLGITSRRTLKSEKLFSLGGGNRAEMNDSQQFERRTRTKFALLAANRWVAVASSTASLPHQSNVSAPILDCRPFPPSDAWPTAFNNISAQFLSRTVVSDNWALNCLSAAPNYEILDLIGWQGGNLPHTGVM